LAIGVEAARYFVFTVRVAQVVDSPAGARDIRDIRDINRVITKESSWMRIVCVPAASMQAGVDALAAGKVDVAATRAT
jgi:NADH/NAD ratio-sensing transcriptional regulator Rex